jgi:hypothetical protein
MTKLKILKEECKFQRDQAVAMFDGFGQFITEMLLLGAIGICQIAIIYLVFGTIFSVFALEAK